MCILVLSYVVLPLHLLAHIVHCCVNCPCVSLYYPLWYVRSMCCLMLSSVVLDFQMLLCIVLIAILVIHLFHFIILSVMLFLRVFSHIVLR